ncbi:MAG: hypothetical protein Q9168_004114 [Polycauliona sp. 1 TL-2023]
MFSVAPTQVYRPGCCDITFENHYLRFEFTAMIKTLLLHGEMDALFMLAAYDSEKIVGNWNIALENCQPSEQGWCEVRDLALYPFLCLNVLYAAHMASGHDLQPTGQDYRRTKAYQLMLVRCTGTKEFGCYLRDSAFDPETFPHRQFFGVHRGQYRNDLYQRSATSLDTDPTRFYGKEPISKPEHKQDSAHTYMPTVADVDKVYGVLRKSGLPPELVEDILDKADYQWTRRSPFSNDPMHLDNRDELLQYLKYCWILLVRCDLLAKACGKKFDWVNDVSHCVHDLFGVNHGTLRRIEYNYEARDAFPDILPEPISWIKWRVV